MANYASSVLTTAQAMLNRKYNEAELRRKQRPATNLAVKNQDYAIPNHAELKKSDDRPVTVKYLLKKAAGNATAKSALHTGNKGDSGTVTLAYSRFVETFRVSRKQAQNNVIGFQDMFNHEVEQAISNLLDRTETYLISALVDARCQLAAAAIETSGTGAWNEANYALEVASANKNRFYQFAKSFMMGRLYRGELDGIADLAAYREFEHLMNQGAGNSANLSYQGLGWNVVPTVDNILAAYAGGAGTAIITPRGAMAGLVWNDPENRKGLDAGDNNVGMLGTLLDPFGSGVIFDVSKYTQRADESGAGGNVQDIKDEWEVSLTIGLHLPPVSTANDSPIHLITQLV